MIQRISPQQLDTLVARGIDIVDVREPDEVNAGKIPGAKHWPLSTLGTRRQELSQSRPTLFYCNSGVRSAVAAELAEDWTGQLIYSLDGGLRELTEDAKSRPSH